MVISADVFRKNFLKILVAFIILLAFFYIIAPFSIPIIIGGILAMAFSPFLGIFNRMGWNRKLSLILMTVVLFFVGVAPISLVLFRGTRAVKTFLSQQSLASTKIDVEEKIYTFLDHLSQKANLDPEMVREKFESFMSSAGTTALNILSSFVAQIPDMFLLSFIAILSFYFFLIDEGKIRLWFDRYFYFTKENGDRFITLLKLSCKEIFISNVITGIIQASIVAGGAFFCKTGDFFIVFIITFFFSFIPIGASPIGFILAISAFIDHRVGAGVAMAIIAAFSGIIDNFIRPYLNSRGSTKAPGFVNFLAIIGGVLALGLPGLLVGPLLASLTYGALPIILDEWFPKNAEENEKN